MNGKSGHLWSLEERLQALKEIAAENRHRNPVASVMAIAEANRVLGHPGSGSSPSAPLVAATKGSVTSDIHGTGDKMPNAFTPRTLGERWQCSARHVANLCKSGVIPSFLLGGQLLRIKREDVEAFEATNWVPDK